MSWRGAGADFFPAYADLSGGMLFHFSGFTSSPAALGGAVCAPRTGENVNPATRATTETTKHLDISEMPPTASIPTLQIYPRLRQSKSQPDCDRLGPLIVAARAPTRAIPKAGTVCH